MKIGLCGGGYLDETKYCILSVEDGWWIIKRIEVKLCKKLSTNIFDGCIGLISISSFTSNVGLRQARMNE